MEVKVEMTVSKTDNKFLFYSTVNAHTDTLSFTGDAHQLSASATGLINSPVKRTDVNYQQRCWRAVSYTHLDVYKRQDLT